MTKGAEQWQNHTMVLKTSACEAFITSAHGPVAHVSHRLESDVSRARRGRPFRQVPAETGSKYSQQTKQLKKQHHLPQVPGT